MDISKKSRIVYGFWMGGTPCSIRQQTLDELPLYFKNLGITFTLITPANIDLYVEQAGEKLHEGFQYLSAVHKSDYLRCYFMHFLGGGYIDIKPPGTGWNKAFDKLETTDSYYAVSEHIGPASISVAWEGSSVSRISYEKYKINYLKIMTQAALICKPKTPFTEEWYNSLQTKMDTYLPALKENPARHARDREVPGTRVLEVAGYPIRWVELLADIFFPACYNHSHHLGFIGDQQFRNGILPSQLKDFLSNRLLRTGCFYVAPDEYVLST